MTEFSESIEGPEVDDLFTDQDRADLAALAEEPEAPNYHPILQVWRAILEPAVDEMTAPITPQWANRITSSYREVNFADMPEVQRRTYGKVLEMASIVETVIEADDDCLTYPTPEEDVEHNSDNYREVLLHWQLLMLGWELEWDCTDPHAAAEIAALSEVHRMFFGQTGLTQYLDNIRFEYTEDDQAKVAAALTELKEKHESKEGK